MAIITIPRLFIDIEPLINEHPFQQRCFYSAGVNPDGKDLYATNASGTPAACTVPASSPGTASATRAGAVFSATKI